MCRRIYLAPVLIAGLLPQVIGCASKGNPDVLLVKKVREAVAKKVTPQEAEQVVGMEATLSTTREADISAFKKLQFGPDNEGRECPENLMEQKAANALRI